MASETDAFATVMVEMDGLDRAKDSRVQHRLAEAGLRPARNTSLLAQSRFFTRAGTLEVAVHQPPTRLGPVARQFHAFQPTHKDVVNALRIAATASASRLREPARSAS